jgi:hypothetical protein
MIQFFIHKGKLNYILYIIRNFNFYVNFQDFCFALSKVTYKSSTSSLPWRLKLIRWLPKEDIISQMHDNS